MRRWRGRRMLTYSLQVTFLVSGSTSATSTRATSTAVTFSAGPSAEMTEGSSSTAGSSPLTKWFSILLASRSDPRAWLARSSGSSSALQNRCTSPAGGETRANMELNGSFSYQFVISPSFSLL